MSCWISCAKRRYQALDATILAEKHPCPSSAQTTLEKSSAARASGNKSNRSHMRPSVPVTELADNSPCHSSLVYMTSSCLFATYRTDERKSDNPSASALMLSLGHPSNCTFISIMAVHAQWHKPRPISMPQPHKGHSESGNNRTGKTPDYCRWYPSGNPMTARSTHAPPRTATQGYTPTPATKTSRWFAA